MDKALVDKLRTAEIERAEAVNPKDKHASVKLPMLSVVPPSAIIALADAMRDGARKYGPYNWRKTPVIASVYVDAAMRHLLAWFDGEERATDSKVNHLAHGMATLAIIVDALSVGTLEDDRPPKGAAAALLEMLKKENPNAASELVQRSGVSDGGRVEQAGRTVGRSHEFPDLGVINATCKNCGRSLADISAERDGGLNSVC